MIWTIKCLSSLRGWGGSSQRNGENALKMPGLFFVTGEGAVFVLNVFELFFFFFCYETG